MTIAFLAAMTSELRPIVKRLKLEPARLGNVDGYRGSVNGTDVIAAITTMGTVAARNVTEAVLDAEPVERVVMVGIAGGIDSITAVGDVIVPERVLDGATGATYEPAPVPGFAASGVLHTSDVLMIEPERLQALVADGVIALDMETASIGAVCEARGVPWSVVRAISDIAGDGADDEIFAMTKPDGSADPAQVAKYLMKHPGRVRDLGRLAKGASLAVQRSVSTALRAFLPTDSSQVR
jgi:adenosylhomocysteine nucleosidase